MRTGMVMEIGIMRKQQNERRARVMVMMDIDTAIDQLRAQGYRVTFATLDSFGFSQYTVFNPKGTMLGVYYGKTIARLLPEGFFGQPHIRGDKG